MNGVGVIPFVHINGENQYLIGKTRQGDWADLSATRLEEESALQTAARAAHEGSRGVLGENSSLANLLSSRRRAQSFDTGPDENRHRTYFVSLNPTLQATLINDFNESNKKIEKYGGYSQLSWVKASDVFAAICKNHPSDNKGVRLTDGSSLRPQVVAALRKTASFQKYLKAHGATLHIPQVPEQCQADRLVAGAKVLGKPDEGTVPHIILRSGKVFAVLKQSGETEEDLVLEDRSYLNPEYQPSLFERLLSLFAWIFPSLKAPTQHERWAVWEVMQDRGPTHRLANLFDRWKAKPSPLDSSLQ